MPKSQANNKINRFPKREITDKQQINEIIDQALYCTVSFILDNKPYAIPTIHARKNDLLYFHGARNGRFLTHLKSGADLCVTITLLDGLVLARSAFNHSINYRTVIAYGNSFEITEESEKKTIFKAITEHVMPGRWNDIRQPNAKELAATSIVAMPLDKVSAKMRTGFSNESKSDYELPIWSGIVPLQIQAETPKADAKNKVADIPDYVKKYINS